MPGKPAVHAGAKEEKMRREVAVESTAEAYLELLAARGIDYFFANGGTDFGPIVEAYAKRLASELPVPKPVTVPHEITAVAMAHGYTMVTGRPQVVMVHTIAGTANAVGGLINASRTQIPMLFTAGRTPTTESGLKGSRSRLFIAPLGDVQQVVDEAVRRYAVEKLGERIAELRRAMRPFEERYGCTYEVFY